MIFSYTTRFDFSDTGARFSACGLYRFLLWRRWSDDPCCNFLMLNPSYADEWKNDPTVERCERRARMWGYGGLIVTNIFAYRGTDPACLKTTLDPVGLDNDDAICIAARASSRTIVAWGNHGALNGRGNKVRELLHRAGITPYCLRIAKSGHPCHPLYLPYDLTPKALLFASVN